MTILDRIKTAREHGHGSCVVHDGTAHPDEIVALMLLLGIREIRRNDGENGETLPKICIFRSRDEEIIRAADILVDVGVAVYDEDAYAPEEMRFDHHHNLDLPASYKLVAKHLVEPHLPGFMKEAKAVFTWWDSAGEIDRFGLGGKNGKGFSDVELARQPVGDGMLTYVSGFSYIMPGHHLHTMLKMAGKALIQKVTRIPRQARKIEGNHEMLRFKKNGQALDVLVTPEHGDGTIFARADVSYNVSVYDHEGKGHIYTNPQRFSLSPLKSPRKLMKQAQLHKPGMLERMQEAQRLMDPAEFVHENGHLAAYSTIKEAKDSLRGLLLATGWSQM